MIRNLVTHIANMLQGPCACRNDCNEPDMMQCERLAESPEGPNSAASVGKTDPDLTTASQSKCALHVLIDAQPSMESVLAKPAEAGDGEGHQPDDVEDGAEDMSAASCEDTDLETPIVAERGDVGSCSGIRRSASPHSSPRASKRQKTTGAEENDDGEGREEVRKEGQEEGKRGEEREGEEEKKNDSEVREENGEEEENGGEEKEKGGEEKEKEEEDENVQEKVRKEALCWLFARLEVPRTSETRDCDYHTFEILEGALRVYGDAPADLVEYTRLGDCRANCTEGMTQHPRSCGWKLFTKAVEAVSSGESDATMKSRALKLLSASLSHIPNPEKCVSRVRAVHCLDRCLNDANLSSRVAEAALNFLAELTQYPDQVEDMRFHNMPLSAADAMRRFGGDADVFLAGIKFFSYLVKNTDHLADLENDVVVRPILEGLKTHLGNAEAQKPALSLLRLLCGGSEKVQQLLGESAYLALLRDILGDIIYKSEQLGTACCVIEQLARRSEENKCKMVNLGFAQVLVVALVGPDSQLDTATLASILRVLINLCGDDPLNRAQVFQSGVLPHVLSGLRGERRMPMLEACQLISVLAEDEFARSEMVVDEAPALLEKLADRTEDPEVREAATCAYAIFSAA